MTNVKGSSHKKRKLTRLEVTKARILDKRTRPPGTPPRKVCRVTQSQSTLLSQSPQALVGVGVGRSSALLEPPNVRPSPSSHPLGSPLADDAAIADMASGNLIRNLHLDDDDTAIQGRRLYMDTGAADSTDAVRIDYSVDTVVDASTARATVVDKSTGIRQHKKKVAKVDVCVLNDKVVFPWLRTRHLQVLKDELDRKERKESDSAQRIRAATNYFDPITYKRKIKVEPGKSTRIANQNARIVTPEHTGGTRKPTFDLVLASKCSPLTDWSRVHSNFSLDSRKLRRYVVEDLMRRRSSKEVTVRCCLFTSMITKRRR